MFGTDGPHHPYTRTSKIRRFVFLYLLLLRGDISPTMCTYTRSTHYPEALFDFVRPFPSFPLLGSRLQKLHQALETAPRFKPFYSLLDFFPPIPLNRHCVGSRQKLNLFNPLLDFVAPIPLSRHCVGSRQKPAAPHCQSRSVNHLDLSRAPYVLYGVKYIDPVWLDHAGQ